MSRRHTGARQRATVRPRASRITVLALSAAMLAVPMGLVTHADAARLQPKTLSPSTALAVIKTISSGGGGSLAVAINDVDDSVYVTNQFSATVTVIDGRTGTVDHSFPVPNPFGVAVDQADDTIYVVSNATPGKLSVINGRSTDDSTMVTVGNGSFGVAIDEADDSIYVSNGNASSVSVIDGRTNLVVGPSISVGNTPIWLAVDQAGNTVYVSNFVSNSASVIDGRTRSITGFSVGTSPRAVAVNQADDTIYISNSSSNTLSVIDDRTRSVSATVAVRTSPYGVAVDQADDTVYVTSGTSPGFLTAINGRSPDDSTTITIGDFPRLTAVDGAGPNAGLVYACNWSSGTVSVIGRVTPSLGASSGPAGSSSTITLDVPQAAYDVDGSTITSVAFGGTPATGLTAVAGDSWTLTVPAGTGTVPVTVTFNGGLTASAGDFTYGAAPTPTPSPPAPTPPTPAPAIIPAAQVLSGQAGMPVSPTSAFTLENFTLVPRYSVYPALPAGLAMDPATGVVTGTPTEVYPATRHWITATAGGNSESAYSTLQVSVSAGPTPTPTPTPTPAPSITIVGSRDGQRIEVTGTATELTGTTLRPWIRFPGQAAFTQGAALITQGSDGTFTWSRSTGKKAYVYVAHEGTRSNTVTIPAR